MDDDTLEIVLYIADKLRRGENLQTITESLVDTGHDSDEIHFALQCFLLTTEATSDETLWEKDSPIHGVRMLDDSESVKISSQAYGYLLGLRTLGIVDDRQMEDMLDEAMHIGEDEISLEQMRDLASAIMFKKFIKRHDDGLEWWDPDPEKERIH
jgi:uncharacterized protein Smg (DUF494 family)